MTTIEKVTPEISELTREQVIAIEEAGVGPCTGFDPPIPIIAQRRIRYGDPPDVWALGDHILVVVRGIDYDDLNCRGNTVQSSANYRVFIVREHNTGHREVLRTLIEQRIVALDNPRPRVDLGHAPNVFGGRYLTLYGIQAEIPQFLHCSAVRVRVEVVQWQRRGGGLSEIQVFKDDQNVALGKKTRASTTYDERFPHSSLTDGITSSARKARGYWLLPNSTAGWAEVYLAED